MNLKNLFMVNALVALIFGLAFVLVPAQTTALYDVDLTEGGKFIGQLFGAELIGYAVLSWLAKDAKPSAERQAILLALFVGDVLGFVASLLAQLAGLANALGWSTVAIYLLLALAFGYFRFMAGGRVVGSTA
jgi:hypothetical protein